jgi:anti-sigma B factor antagonist
MLEISQNEAAPGTVVITVAGKLMLGPEGDRVITMVEGLLQQGIRTIVFDLSGLAAIDSTGIGRFIHSFNKISAAGGEMRMAAASGHVWQSFRVSLLDKVFRFYPSVAEAVGAG